MTIKGTVLAATLVALLAATAGAQTFGRLTYVVPETSDVLLTVPFSKTPDGSFTVDSVSGGNVINCTGTPFAGTTYAGLHYVRITSGPAAGVWATITSNTASSLTLDLRGDAALLAGVAGGHTFNVVGHQTLGTVFSDDLESIAFKKTTDPFNPGTQVLVPDEAAGGTELPKITFQYANDPALSGFAWRRVGANPFQSFNDYVLPPQKYFVVRNNGTTKLHYKAEGNIETVTLGQYLATKDHAYDIPTGTGRPTPVKLRELNLGGTAAFETTMNPFAPADQLLVFDNANPPTPPEVPSPAHTFIYAPHPTNPADLAWRRVGSNPAQSWDDFELPAGSAFIIRKGAGSPGTALWNQVSPY